MNIKKVTFEIDLDEVKDREDFLRLLDDVLKYEFVGFYNDNNIAGMLYRREKKKTKVLGTDKTGEKE